MVCMWKGVALKRDHDVAAINVDTEAVEIRENASILEDKLTILSVIKIKVLDPRTLSGM